jgi:hypothetical protein
MISQLSIVKKTSTFLDEMIHIMPRCAMYLHGHQNKMAPFLKPFILEDLNDGAKFHNYTYGQLMTFLTTISHVGSATTTLTTKTWSS